MSRQTTSLAIVTALDELMYEKPLDTIKVADICQRLDIARSTFYRHFPNVAAIAPWLWDQANRNGIYQEGRTLGCYEAHLNTFTALRRYRHFFGEALKTVDYSSVCQHGGRVMQRYLEDVFFYKMGRQFGPDEALLVEFFSSGAKHMTRHWCTRGMVEEPPAMARAFADSMPAFMRPHLEPDATCTVEVRVE